jgi:hypothetical protein
MASPVPLSAKGIQNTRALWTELFALSDVKLHLSSAFRPQTDGQSKVTNLVLGVYLRCLAGDHPRS